MADIIELFLAIQRIDLETIPTLIEELSPWERGQMQKRIRLLLRELDRLPTSTYDDNGTFTVHAPESE